MKISLPKKYLDALIEITDRSLQHESGAIYLFGSRVKGTDSVGSDVDLAIECEHISDLSIGKMRESLEESSLPYIFDIIDLHHNTSAEFRDIVKAEGILIWKH
jgi:predicted nucleotidyltransferase